jgi:hypothetical protein
VTIVEKHREPVRQALCRCSAFYAREVGSEPGLFFERLRQEMLSKFCPTCVGLELSLKSKTGVEMEALTAVQVALLTIYDMCKAVDRGMTITGVRLLEKQGGKSGHYVAG